MVNLIHPARWPFRFIDYEFGYVGWKNFSHNPFQLDLID